jgi:ABC-2 type transport system ATP-binding protein
MNEVEEVCNRVAIVRSGAIVYEGALAELKQTAGTSYRLRTSDDERALAVCRAQEGVTEARAQDGELRIAATEPAVERLSAALIGAGVLIRALAPETATLEDLFFRLTEDDADTPEAVAA